MKRILPLAILLAACSTPKYTYNFSHYNEWSNSSAREVQPPVPQNTITADALVASIAPEAVTPFKPQVSNPTLENGKREPSVKKEVLTREEKRTVRKELRKEIKTYKKEIKNDQKNDGVKSDKAAKAMDNDLKLAAIFGAIGIVGLILGGAADVFSIIGGIALLIGVIFFVLWLARQ